MEQEITELILLEGILQTDNEDCILVQPPHASTITNLSTLHTAADLT